MSSAASLQTERTTVKRRPQRGAYDRATVHAILDEALICHLGFAVDGQPYVLPTIYARVGDVLYVHGSSASRMLRTLAGGVEACVTVTLMDGLVLARSAFHHSMNYRSVVVLGRARAVTERAEKIAALEAVVEHVVPGRLPEVRPPSDQELKATAVLTLPLEEASAKIRSGGPLDDDEDLAIPVWAGHLPLVQRALSPVDAPDLAHRLEAPPYITDYRRP